MCNVYDLGEMIISDKENQAGPQGTGSQNESYFMKNRKWMPLNLCQIRNIQRAASWLVKEWRLEVEAGS